MAGNLGDHVGVLNFLIQITDEDILSYAEKFRRPTAVSTRASPKV